MNAGTGTLAALRWALLVLGAGRAPAVLAVIGDRHNAWSRRIVSELAFCPWPIGDGVAALLIERGADVNAKDEMQDSPFLYAGAQGRLEILRMTLAAGADLKSTNRYGGTALIPAAHHGHVETVRELLKTKIDVDHVNRLGWTALLEAIILGDGGAAHTEIVRSLVAHGARLQLADAQGVTPLEHAEQRGQRAVVEILRRAGARR